MQRWPQTLNKLIDESLIKEVQPDKVLELVSAILIQRLSIDPRTTISHSSPCFQTYLLTKY
tara:strand:- start:47 stop:229 length:183 start_codon:yes stop_codon:yes gene_type:complete